MGPGRRPRRQQRRPPPERPSRAGGAGFASSKCVEVSTPAATVVGPLVVGAIRPPYRRMAQLYEPNQITTNLKEPAVFATPPDLADAAPTDARTPATLPADAQSTVDVILHGLRQRRTPDATRAGSPPIATDLPFA